MCCHKNEPLGFLFTKNSNKNLRVQISVIIWGWGGADNKMECPQGPAWVKHGLETDTYRDRHKGVIEPMTATKKSTTIIAKYWGNDFLLHAYYVKSGVLKFTH